MRTRLTRRQFLKRSLLLAIGTAVAGTNYALNSERDWVGSGSIKLPWAMINNMRRAKMSTTIGAQIAWLLGLQDLTDTGEYQLMGISPQGDVIGQFGPVQSPPLRSLDGN